MSQRPPQASTGLYRLLFHPLVYEMVQRLLGSDKARRWIVHDLLRVTPESRLLDLGCGTAELLGYLGPVAQYVGVDNNPEYIQQARAQFGETPQRRFLCSGVDDLDEQEFGQFDRVFAIGVLHHLDDASCSSFFRVAKRCLAKDGLAITADPCYFSEQSRFARWVTSLDRGKSVRTPEEYQRLARDTFEHIRYTLKDRPNALPTTSCVIYGALSEQVLEAASRPEWRKPSHQ